MVNLPAVGGNSGRLNVAYLPLQGRALETFTVLIPNIEVGVGSDTFIEPFSGDIQFVLNGNQVQERSTEISVQGPSQGFNTFYLNLDSLIDNTDPNGSGGATVYGSPNSPFLQEQGFPANIRVFPSRETTLPVFLNDSMIGFVTDSLGNVTAEFLPDQFTARNGTPLQAFISDFLAFDISNMGASRPTMINGKAANRVYFSGDKFGFSDAGPSGFFEMLTEDANNPDQGEFSDPVSVSGVGTPGIYRTIVPDPTDPTGTNTITELYGIYRQFVDPNSTANSMVRNTGSFEVITMPKTPDDDDQQIILVALNGSKVTNLYWGDVHLISGSFVAYPLSNLMTGSSLGSIQGTVSGFLDAFGSPVSVTSSGTAQRVHYGRYQITSLPPAGLSRSGRFIVYRK